MTTYQGLQNDNQFINSGIKTLRLLDRLPDMKMENTPEYRRAVVDQLLEEKRWGGLATETTGMNLTSVLRQGRAFSDATPEQAQHLFYVGNQIQKLPNLFEEGAPPAFENIKEHVAGAASDPVNLLGAFMGFQTAGASGAAALATRQAAQRGVAKYIANRAKLAFQKPVLKAFAVESAITGAGGTAKSLSQQTDRIGLNFQKELDLGDALFVGAMEGPLAVGFGGSFNTAVGALSRSIDNSVGDTAAAQWMKNNLLPKSYRDETSTHILEEVQGISSEFNHRAQVAARDLEHSINKNTTKNNRDGVIRDVMSVLRGDRKLGHPNRDHYPFYRPRGVYNKLHSEIQKATDTASTVIKDARSHAANLPNVSPGFRQIFDSPTWLKDGYARLVYEVFSVNKRAVPFDKFLDKNPEVIDELISAVRQPKGDRKKTWFASLEEKYPHYTQGLTRSSFTGKNARENARILAQRMYQPQKGRFKLSANVSESLEAIPAVQRRIWGDNYSASQSVVESVAGIMNSVEKAYFAQNLQKSLAGRGQAVRAASTLQARAIINKTRKEQGLDPIPTKNDIVRVIGTENQGALIPFDKPNNLFVPTNTKDKASRAYYTTKEVQDRLAPVIREFDKYQPLFNSEVAESIARGSARVQGTLKVGKTVFSPVAIVRNASGAIGSVLSGNPYQWLPEVTKAIFKMSPAERRELTSLVRTLGVTGQSIDIGQALTRLGRDINENPGFIEKVGSFGVGAFPKIYRKFMGFYGGTDDFFKMITFLAEFGKQRQIWKEMAPEQRTAYLNNWQNELGRTLSPNQLFAHASAIKTKRVMPIYSRVPRITEHKLTRSIPVIGNFSAYPSENFRNVSNVFRLGGEEMAEGFALGNAPLVRSGVSRLLGISAIASAPYITAQMVAEANGTESILEVLRDFVPPWDRNGALMLESDPKEDELRYINLSYSNPHQPFLEAIIPLIVGLGNGDDSETAIQDGILTAAKSFVSPYTDPSMTLQAANYLIKGGDNPANLANFYKILQPGFVKFGLDAAQKMGALKGRDRVLGLDLTPNDIERALYPKFFNEARKPPQTIGELGDILYKQGLNPGAFTTRTINKRTSIGFAAREINANHDKSMSKIKSTLLQGILDISDPLELGSDQMDIWFGEVDDAYQVDFAHQKAFRDLYQDAVTLYAGNEGKVRRIFFGPNLKGVLPREDVRKMMTVPDERNPVYLPSKDFFTKQDYEKFVLGIRNLPENIKREKRTLLREATRGVYEIQKDYIGRSLLESPSQDL